MAFRFCYIWKQPNILTEMRRHLISGSAAMIFYHPKWNFIPVKMTDMKSIPAMDFKRTSALNAISNESELIHFVSGKILFSWKSYAGLKFHFGQNDRYKIHTVLSFISPRFMWTQVKNWPNIKVRFSTEMKSHTGLNSFHLSCEHTLINKVYLTFLFYLDTCNKYVSSQGLSSGWLD